MYNRCVAPVPGRWPRLLRPPPWPCWRQQERQRTPAPNPSCSAVQPAMHAAPGSSKADVDWQAWLLHCSKQSAAATLPPTAQGSDVHPQHAPPPPTTCRHAMPAAPHRRAAPMQGALALTGFTAAAVAAAQGGHCSKWLWGAAAAAIGCVWPYTLLAMMPTNKKLLAPVGDTRSLSDGRCVHGGGWGGEEARLDEGYMLHKHMLSRIEHPAAAERNPAGRTRRRLRTPASMRRCWTSGGNCTWGARSWPAPAWRSWCASRGAAAGGDAGAVSSRCVSFCDGPLAGRAPARCSRAEPAEQAQGGPDTSHQVRCVRGAAARLHARQSAHPPPACCRAPLVTRGCPRLIARDPSCTSNIVRIRFTTQLRAVPAPQLPGAGTEVPARPGARAPRSTDHQHAATYFSPAHGRAHAAGE
jgi:hypothetical protein